MILNPLKYVRINNSGNINTCVYNKIDEKQNDYFHYFVETFKTMATQNSL